jgi:hypothetical protein
MAASAPGCWPFCPEFRTRNPFRLGTGVTVALRALCAYGLPRAKRGTLRPTIGPNSRLFFLEDLG